MVIQLTHYFGYYLHRETDVVRMSSIAFSLSILYKVVYFVSEE